MSDPCGSSSCDYSDDDYGQAEDREYYRPLKRAIQNGDLKEVKRLVEEKHIDPDRYITFRPDKLALYVAYETGNDEIIEYLLNHGAEPLHSFLCYPFGLGIQEKVNNYARKLMLEQIKDRKLAEKKAREEKAKEKKAKEEEEEED